MEATHEDGTHNAGSSFWKVVLNQEVSQSDSGEDDASTPRENETTVFEKSHFSRDSQAGDSKALNSNGSADSPESPTGRDIDRTGDSELEDAEARVGYRDVRHAKCNEDNGDVGLVMIRDSKGPQEAKVQCNQCSVTIDESALTTHISTVHNGSKTNFICEDCGKGFKFKSGYSLHRSKQHGVELPRIDKMSKGKSPMKPDISNLFLSCEICGKEFRHISSFTLHLQRHQPEGIFDCGICEKTFFTEAAFKDHHQKHQNLKPSQCPVCMTMCGRPAQYRKHVEQHQSDPRYQCDQCPKVFAEVRNLVAHLLGHMKNILHSGSVCNDTFSSRCDKNIHENGLGVNAEPVDTKNTVEKQPRRDDVPGSSPYEERQSGHHRRRTDSSGPVCQKRPKKRVYRCRLCGMKFNRVHLLRVHYKDHVHTKSITCQVCGEQFSYRSKFRKHMDSHADDVIYKCVVCYKQFTCMDSLEKHVAGHTDECLDCCVCGEQLTDISDIMEHVKKHKYCQITIAEDEKSTRDSQNDNPDTQSKRVQVKCSICAKKFHFVSSLQSHMRIHQDDQTVNCHICGETHPGVKALREHICTHKTEADPTGQGTIGGGGKLDKTVCSGGKKKRHRCDICLEKFVNYYNCKAHRLLHTGERAFRCEHCGRSYVLAGALKIHMLSHTKNRPHVCEICGKSFKQPYILREHQMSHTGHKPILCDICGKSFVNKKKLRLHNFVHTRETPFNCNVCGRGFRAFVTRQKHVCEGPPDSARKEVTSNTTSPMTVDNVQNNGGCQKEAPPPPSQTFPSFQPAYEDFAYHQVAGSDYSSNNQTVRQEQRRHLCSQDSSQALESGSSTVEAGGSYSRHVTSYNDLREPQCSFRPPPPINWQLSPCNSGLPGGIGQYSSK